MKKITRIFALALAFVMAFALQAPVNGRESAVNQEKSTGNRTGRLIYTQSPVIIL